MDRDHLVFIFGPTAAGKTELACEAADGIGEIVSVDSMQVYRGLDRGTSKPSPEQLARVRHHLVSVVAPVHRFSAGDFRRSALEAIAGIRSRGKIPFLVGGTGLYFRALEYELADAPPADLPLRESLYGEEEARPGALHEKLRRVDPETARTLSAKDLVRLVRALEIHALTGRRFSAFVRGSFVRRYSPLKIGVTAERGALYSRIEKRCREMVRAGLADEVRGLLEGGCTERDPSMNALGYSHFIQHLKGCRSRDETLRLFVRDSKRYAKRQLTWFRREEDVIWLCNRGCAGELAPLARRAVETYLNR